MSDSVERVNQVSERSSEIRVTSCEERLAAVAAVARGRLRRRSSSSWSNSSEQWASSRSCSFGERFLSLFFVFLYDFCKKMDSYLDLCVSSTSDNICAGLMEYSHANLLCICSPFVCTSFSPKTLSRASFTFLKVRKTRPGGVSLAPESAKWQHICFSNNI